MIHIDYLGEEEYVFFRAACMQAFKLPGLLYSDLHYFEKSRYGHNLDVCRCYMSILHIGQDEKIWSIKGFLKLMKKGVVKG
jgi:hypothetical protein